ncbi:hypothetical protein CTA2_6709 [Colletotrichum tanaceti]|nr:hypothetical protein CTA2_6709 [Colletotrichum tanaceti]
MTLLLPQPPVDSEDRRAGREHVLCVRERRLPGVQYSDLRRHGDWQVLVQRVDELEDELLVLLEESAVLSLLGDALRAPQVQIHGVAVRRHPERRAEEGIRVVCAELHEERAVDGGVAVEPGLGRRRLRRVGIGRVAGSHGLEVALAVVFRVFEQPRVKHGRVCHHVLLLGRRDEGPAQHSPRLQPSSPTSAFC